MGRHVSVRLKGSRWATTAHRAEGRQKTGGDRRPASTGQIYRPPPTVAGEDDLLLNLAVRHFVDLQPTSREAEAFAEALSQTVATGQTVCVTPETSSEQTYEISRRIAAVTIRFGDAQMHLPIHAALQLAGALQQMHAGRLAPDLAA